jgi:uncharacterized protein YlxW (UPF0749 family)
MQFLPRWSPWAGLVPVVGLAAGAMFAASRAESQGQDLRSDVSSLSDLIRKQTQLNTSRQALVATVQREVDDLTRRARPDDAALGKLNDDADALADPAGRTAVHGPGLTVQLDDSPLRGDQIPDGMTVDDIVVHQQDVQAVVNALWRGGAESMMLMDQRVISTSAVRCVGNTLILQGRVYSPPFVIKAIGDPDALQAALDADTQISIYREYVKAADLGYDVERFRDERFPAFEGSIRLDHATVAETAR